MSGAASRNEKQIAPFEQGPVIQVSKHGIGQFTQ